MKKFNFKYLCASLIILLVFSSLSGCFGKKKESKKSEIIKKAKIDYSKHRVIKYPEQTSYKNKKIPPSIDSNGDDNDDNFNLPLGSVEYATGLYFVPISEMDYCKGYKLQAVDNTYNPNKLAVYFRSAEGDFIRKYEQSSCFTHGVSYFEKSINKNTNNNYKDL